MRLSGGREEREREGERETEREGERERNTFSSKPPVFPEPVSAPRLTAAPHCLNWEAKEKKITPRLLLLLFLL